MGSGATKETDNCRWIVESPFHLTSQQHCTNYISYHKKLIIRELVMCIHIL
jgi:hypothetical protein